MNSIEINRAVEVLHPMIRQGDCVAWIGSGLSQPAGYRNWRELLRYICTECGVDHIPGPDMQDTGSLLALAQRCKKANKDKYFRAFLKEYGEPVCRQRDAYRLLLLLPFTAYITTNFDSCLYAAGSSSWSNIFVYPNIQLYIDKHKKSLFHIHGRIDPSDRKSVKRIVFCQSEFDKAYSSRMALRSFLEQLLTFHPVLFLGCSLCEPPLRKILKRTRKIRSSISVDRPSPNSRRIALLHQTKREGTALEQEDQNHNENIYTSESELFESMGIETLLYTPANLEKHYEVEEILSGLDRLLQGRDNSGDRPTVGG